MFVWLKHDIRVTLRGMMKADDSLVQGWNRRLAILETEILRQSEAWAWHARLEAKVLRFLLKRYPDGHGVLGATVPSVPRVFLSPLAFIAAPKARPAKRQRMKLLHHIAQVNRAVRERKLSDAEQFLQNFDRSIEAQMFKAHARHAQKAKQQEQRDSKPRSD